MNKAFTVLLAVLLTATVWAQNIPPTTLGTDLLGVVTSTQWTAYGGSSLDYDTEQQGFAITTDASGITNHDGYQKWIRLSNQNVLMKARHAYQFVLRMKTNVYPRGQNIIITARDKDHSAQYIERSWNVSRAGSWEEVCIPVFPVVDGHWDVAVWVSSGGRFESTPSTIYISPDLDLYELPAGDEVATLQGINIDTDKDSFESSTQRVDALGNIYTKNENDAVWKHVFPKMMYKGTGSVNTASFSVMCQRYKEYGFTGVMDIWNPTEAQAVISAGMEHISINAYSTGQVFAGMRPYIDNVYQWVNTNQRHQNLIWYNVDNEAGMPGGWDYQQALQEHIDTYHLDPVTGKRRHPIYYLNGQIGLPRSYHNPSRNVMDITGSYVESNGSVGDLNYKTAYPSLLTMFMTQNQRVPATVIQVQSFLQESFIPSLFYGIIMGGRAMCVWRDGTVYGGSQPDFRDNFWAEAFKNDVSPKIDRMLPLIEQPHFTSWKASTDQFPNVRIGTRELKGEGYLILTNFSDQDLPVVVNLHGRQAKEAVDMFTGAHIADVVNGSFQFTLGHYNSGYQVIRLADTVVSVHEEIEGINLAVSAFPNPTNSFFTLKVERYELVNLSYQLFDSYGKLLENKKIVNKETIVSMSNLAPATYFVKVAEVNKEVKTFKIIKN